MYIYQHIFTYFEDIFQVNINGDLEFRFQHCFLLITGKWKVCLDQGKSFGSFLSDLSKSFDSLPHDILITKLNAYGLDESSLQIIQSYLANKHYRTKISSRYSFSPLQYSYV